MGALVYGILVFSLSYRYLPLFPQEAELNPISFSDKAVEGGA
jgi:hypothetical protein